ncbi:TIR domain-containing protein [Pycnococcus provasolii]
MGCAASAALAATLAGLPPLHRAAYLADTRRAHELLRDSCVNVDARNTRGETAMHVVVERGNALITQLLLANGADVEARCVHRQTPLYRAVMHGHANIAKILLRAGADAEARSGANGDTPLHLAARLNREGCVRLLLEAGAEAGARADDGTTPFDAAVKHGYFALAQLIRESTRASLQLPDVRLPGYVGTPPCSSSPPAPDHFATTQTARAPQRRHRVESNESNDHHQSPPWSYFISHCQAETKDYAVDLFHSLRARGEKVWLDVKMTHRDEAAMERGVKESAAVIAILSATYFARPYCLKELEWARTYQTPIIPCVPSSLREAIGALLGKAPAPVRRSNGGKAKRARKSAASGDIVAVPASMQDLGRVNVLTLYREDDEFWNLSLKKVLEAESVLLPQLSHDANTSGVDDTKKCLDTSAADKNHASGAGTSACTTTTTADDIQVRT